MGASREVIIGDGESIHTYTVQRFRGLKAIMAFASITRIAREVPDIMADAVKAYQRRNTTIITEPMARLPRWASFTKEDFDAAEQRSGRREIELPTPMTANEQVLYALPELLTKARKEVTRLLALMIIPNNVLREADLADEVEQALDKFEEALLYDAELDQLVDLAFATQDILSEQLADRKDRLGNLVKSLWGTWQGNQKTPQAQTVPQELPAASQLPSQDQESTQLTSVPDVQTSSTSSGGPMDGTELQPSMASPGASS